MDKSVLGFIITLDYQGQPRSQGILFQHHVKEIKDSLSGLQTAKQ